MQTLSLTIDRNPLVNLLMASVSPLRGFRAKVSGLGPGEHGWVVSLFGRFERTIRYDRQNRPKYVTARQCLYLCGGDFH